MPGWSDNKKTGIGRIKKEKKKGRVGQDSQMPKFEFSISELF